MADTLENKVEGQMAKNRSLVERIAMYVPFYRGYKQKNLRRDEDRAIRDVVAKELFDVKNDLSNASRAALGDLDAMRDSERIKAKVDKYYVDVKKAAAGYSAFHDSIKIMETELDNIISWDAQLIDGVRNLKTVSAQLVQYADTGENIRPALRAVEKEIDAMIEAYNQRENIMKGFVDGKE